MMRSESFGTTTRTALTVSSLTTGATSVKPVTLISIRCIHRVNKFNSGVVRISYRGRTICGKILSVTTFCER
jgi:hypothetical protein